MGSVSVGDFLMGADGRPTRVVAATEVMSGRPCFEVEFSDGTVIVADAEHQWLTESCSETGGFWAIRTTAQLFQRVGVCRVFVRMSAAWELPTAALPLSPRALGLFLSGLGDLELTDRDKWVELSRPVWAEFAKSTPGATQLIETVQKSS